MFQLRVALRSLLRLAAHSVGFSTRSNTHVDAGQKARGHAKDVRVEVMRVEQIDSRRAQVFGEAPKLRDGVQIVKTSQRIGRDGAETEAFDACSQHSVWFQAG